MSRLRRLGLERQKSGVRSQNEEDVLTAYIFFSDPAAPEPAIILPPSPATMSRVMESMKVGSALRINTGRGGRGLLWQAPFFDCALRSLKERCLKECIHLNLVSRVRS